jgi:hypothetical protein
MHRTCRHGLQRIAPTVDAGSKVYCTTQKELPENLVKQDAHCGHTAALPDKQLVQIRVRGILPNTSCMQPRIRYILSEIPLLLVVITVSNVFSENVIE